MLPVYLLTPETTLTTVAHYLKVQAGRQAVLFNRLAHTDTDVCTVKYGFLSREVTAKVAHFLKCALSWRGRRLKAP